MSSGGDLRWRPPPLPTALPSSSSSIGNELDNGCFFLVDFLAVFFALRFKAIFLSRSAIFVV